MRNRLKYTSLAAFALLVVCVLTVTAGSSQTVPSPTRTQCKQWDQAFLSLFGLILGGTFLMTWLVGLLLVPRLAGFWWWATAPRFRILRVSLSFFALAIVLVALGVWTAGLGYLTVIGVDPNYVKCETIRFGAEGLLGGWFGEGVAAIAQWHMMVALCFLASSFGGLLALFCDEILSRRFLGFPAKVKGGGSGGV